MINCRYDLFSVDSFTHDAAFSHMPTPYYLQRLRKSSQVAKDYSNESIRHKHFLTYVFIIETIFVLFTHFVCLKISNTHLSKLSKLQHVQEFKQPERVQRPPFLEQILTF